MDGENSNEHLSHLKKEFDEIKEEWIAVRSSMKTNRIWMIVLGGIAGLAIIIAVLKWLFPPGLSMEDARKVFNEEFEKQHSSEIINVRVKEAVSREIHSVCPSLVDSIWQERIAPRVGGQPITVDGEIVWESVPFNEIRLGSEIYCDSLIPRLTDSINIGGIGVGKQFPTNDSLELRVVLYFPEPATTVTPILGADVFPEGQIPYGINVSASTMKLYTYSGKHNKLRVVTPGKAGIYELVVFYIERYRYGCQNYMRVIKIEVFE